MRALKFVAIGVVAVLLMAGIAGYFTLRASLPQLDGEIVTEGAAASIERDEQGTVTVRARSRRDLAFATGFVHAQDRAFQMDLMRRSAAGELAQLFGPRAVEADRKLRLHDFRRVAKQVIEHGSARERELLDAYAAGVNFALAQAKARPWEYLLLGAEPAPWLVEDTVLVAFSMYLNLNDSTGEEEFVRAQLREVLPQSLFDFLHPLGTEWDAPITGGTWRAAQIPGADVFNLRAGASLGAVLSAPRSAMPLEEERVVGSNSWAVAGTHAQRGALLANDMHLGLRLPHVWYRARLIVDARDDERRDLVGVTLPGLPMLVAGSNGKVAWGYTNSYGDWTDLVVVQADPRDAGRYLVAEGSAPFETRTETIEVRGEAAQTLEIQSTRWGPIVRRDAAGRPLALAWTAHHAQATNMGMLDFEAATNVEQLLDAANRAGGPVQNVLAADASGRIGWSLMGQVPVRAGYDSTRPESWHAAGSGWTGWRAPEEYPRIVDPAAGRLWTANARTIDAETWLAFLGDGGYDLGARAAQIRDGLLALQSPDAADMLAIQLDDRALFLARWRDLLLDLIDAQALNDNPKRAAARRFISNWSGHAAADDVGYRLVRSIRLQVRKDVFEALTATARAKFPASKFVPGAQFEGPLWQLVTQRPQHLLDPRYDSWRSALLASVDAALDEVEKQCREAGNALETCTWGAQNTLSMRHPLSAALPFASRWLDMPAQPLPGDASMPRVQGTTFGASERLVVSPGREADGYFQMPGGPVDHPLSPFYGAGHEAWVHGEPTPLLPGETRYTLRLRPRR